jgi:MacB-like periplasmic core domain
VSGGIDRLYRLALQWLPAETRARHGAEMARVFADQRREARRLAGWRGEAAVAVRELTALARFGWEERRRPEVTRRRAHLTAAAHDLDRRTSMLTAFVQDLGYALRLLRRAPGFAAVCVATIALAIGANTAIFSVVYGVLLKPLPFADPDRIVVLGHHTNGGDAIDSTTPGNLFDWMQGATAFESMAGFAPTERIVDLGGGAERLRGGLIAGDLFRVLGRQAASGRTLSAADDAAGAAPTVVLSAAPWARRSRSTPCPTPSSA